MDDSELSVLPTSYSGDELEDVRLLFGVQFLQVFVGTHLGTGQHWGIVIMIVTK